MGVEQTDKIVYLNHESGSSAEIYFFGATVTSWKVKGQERLFVSSKSALDKSKPIRGGIPIVFPVFGAPPSEPAEYAALKQHGFARSVDWSLEKIVMDRPEGVSVRFLAPAPPSGFDHKYKLAYVVTLTASQLSTDLHVINEGGEDFKFQALLHGYLAVPDVSKVKVSGMGKGTKFFDKANGGKMDTWEQEELTVSQEVDRVYYAVPSQELHLDNGDGSGLKVRFRGFVDCTVWNPQEEVGKKFADMEDKGWERYICIEPGYVREFKTLKPGEEFLGQQILTVV